MTRNHESLNYVKRLHPDPIFPKCVCLKVGRKGNGTGSNSLLWGGVELILMARYRLTTKMEIRYWIQTIHMIPHHMERILVMQALIALEKH
jgi:hypothetical protein